MLIRLKISNFKNLSDVDIRFGAFTCVAGTNGAGKSNLFDAIAFLAALANHPLMEAAQRIRGVEARSDVRALFQRVGEESATELTILAEMIIPSSGTDELGQRAEASGTCLRYELALGWKLSETQIGARLSLLREQLIRIQFPNDNHFKNSKRWKASVLSGSRGSPYISTEQEESKPTIIALHADSGHRKGGGRPRKIPASNLPRTMLSSVTNAEEHPTLVLVRQEMAAWIQLQLEPSALRHPDNFTDPAALAANGAHLPATLYALTLAAEGREEGGAENLRAEVAAQLSQLIESVDDVQIDKDERRQTLSVLLTDLHGTAHAASSLSDGTLRFLALAVLKHTTDQRLICLEEPENGIHPMRIRPIIELLKALAVDAMEPVDATNPMRQVIINTHSPLVVEELEEDELIFLISQSSRFLGRVQTSTRAACLSGTWREAIQPTISRGEILKYLSPTRPPDQDASHTLIKSRPEIRELLFPRLLSQPVDP